MNIEATKIAYDIYKHLTTLNTGSIVLLVALLDKLFSSPEWKLAIAVSLFSFVLSLIACLGMLIVINIDIANDGSFGKTKKQDLIGFWLTASSWGGFAIGVICLVLFAIKNLY